MRGERDESQEPSAGADLGLEVHAVPSGGPKGYGEWGSLGLIVNHGRKDGPAARAGIRVGDILYRIERNFLFSRDDLRDFLTVRSPGSEAAVFYFRAGNQQTVAVKLGQAPGSADESTFRWNYAGLAQLPQALKRAETAGKNVLVGLSGSDT